MEIKNPFDTPEQVEARKNQEDPIILYLIVKESLNMNAGKTAAQVGHAVGMIYGYYYALIYEYYPLYEYDLLAYNYIKIFEDWQNSSYRKVVLRASDKEFEKIKSELKCFVVRDAGLTEIEPGETVIALWPQHKSDCHKLIKKLQVLK